jgi:hypothetical protein
MFMWAVSNGLVYLGTFAVAGTEGGRERPAEQLPGMRTCEGC